MDWINEDELPPLADDEYSRAFENSELTDKVFGGVRMFRKQDIPYRVEVGFYLCTYRASETLAIYRGDGQFEIIGVDHGTFSANAFKDIYPIVDPRKISKEKAELGAAIIDYFGCMSPAQIQSMNALDAIQDFYAAIAKEGSK